MSNKSKGKEKDGKKGISNSNKWAFDLSSLEQINSKNVVAPFPSVPQQIEDTAARKNNSSIKQIKEKKVWEIATSPFKNIMMTGLMAYLSGNSLQIFSIMMTAIAIFTPLKAILTTKSAFERYADLGISSLFIPTLIYIALNGAALAIGIYKVNTLGLLPTSLSDWVSFYAVVKQTIEFCGGGVPFASIK